SNSSISNPIANPSITTTYTVTITDVNGCYATDDVVITVLPIPIINILPSSGKICVGDTITINANGAITYNWTPSIGLSSDTSATTIAQPSVTTTYTVTGANQYGCTNYNSITISVEPLPILTISPNVAGVCSGQSINISVNGAANYIWAPSTGLSSTTGSSVIASPITTTTYNITGISASGCTSDTNYTVTVLPSPLVNFSASISEGCSPLTVNFLNSSTGNIQSWLWNFNDPNSGPLNTSNLANPSHTFNLPGSYDISLTVTNTDGCSDTYTYVGMINVYPQPIANFIMNPNIGSMNQPTISFVDQSVNANSWLWNFGESSSGTNNFSNLQNPQHTYSAPGTYTVWLVVSSNFDCTDSISKTINIQDSYTFWAPNAFTPNGDGINEYFIPKGTGIDPDNFKMYIFDRWGKQIYYTDSYNNPWDGSINSTGKLAPQGVYTWVIKTTDRNGMEMRYIGKILLLP
ncbi:MAG TPA: PKD domain-containing protein, partial [Bacteroidales bacterium]|nr:PKD domain-containing protein [Bacteroidales bacterium]